MKTQHRRSSRRFLSVLATLIVSLLIGCGKSGESSSDSFKSSVTASPAESSSDVSSSDAAAAEPIRESDARKDRTSHDVREFEDSLTSSPRAGLLTAGEWDDLNNWAFWTDLMRKPEWRELQRHWRFYPRNHIRVLARDRSRPVVDAVVTLKNQSDRTVWETRTNNRGEAHIFTGLFSEQEQGTAYSVTVRSGATGHTINIPADRFNDGPVRIDLQGAARDPRKLDVMFMIDATGSMGDEMEYIKTELQDVLERVQRNASQEIDIRLSCNFYRDVEDEYVVRPFPFTNDIGDAVSQIDRQSADGGGDYEEAVEQGLKNAVQEHDWSRDATARLLFLVLDAPPHHTPEILEKLQEMSAEAARLGIRIIPVASSGVNKSTEFLMRFLAVSTGGTYVFLTDDSGIGNSHLKPTVGAYDVEYLNDLLVRVIGKYIERPRGGSEPGERGGMEIR